MLDGLTVIDTSTTWAGAMATMFLADAGADVVFVEPPGGSPLRLRPDWPAVGRGKHSVVLDLTTPAGRLALRELIGEADVFVTTSALATDSPSGLSLAELAALNSRLVSASITGWGPGGPYAGLPDHEGLVMAKLGYFHAKARLVSRPGPAYISTPFASWGAAHTGVHGILAALYEREASGHGQHIDADAVRGVNTLDTWAWYTELVGLRWPGAYEIAEAFTADGQVLGHLIYPLVIALTQDGHWIQFAQVQPRLFAAMMQEFGLAEMLADPKWSHFPHLETQALRTEFWELLLTRVQQRTLAEWHAVFESNPDILAEQLRSGPDVLNHPQLIHDHRVVDVDDPELGPVRQPSTMVYVDAQPTTVVSRAPRIDEHTGDPRVRLHEFAASTSTGPIGKLPLDGVTVLELGVMYAAPFGPTLLADLGARVIKIEQLDGDPIRGLMPFPELAGAKVMQGKESIALDINTPEGLKIVHELARRSDIVMQGFRAGAAARIGVDSATLRALNPKLVYVNAPGYGTGGPFGHRPAYAPSIGAAAGLALADFPAAAEEVSGIEDIKRAAAQLNTAGAIPQLQADGIAALGVASTLLLGLLARARGRYVGELTTTMLSTAALANIDRVIDYAGRPASRTVDPEGYGLDALYRLYPAATGWVFLAAPTEAEVAALFAALESYAPSLSDGRFGTAPLRMAAESELARILAGVFSTRPAAEWERDLTALNVGCVQAHEGSPQKLLQVDTELAAEYASTATSPVFDEHLRPAAAVHFSRSRTRAEGFCGCGRDTDALLAELGYEPKEIDKLRSNGITH